MQKFCRWGGFGKFSFYVNSNRNRPIVSCIKNRKKLNSNARMWIYPIMFRFSPWFQIYNLFACTPKMHNSALIWPTITHVPVNECPKPLYGSRASSPRCNPVAPMQSVGASLGRIHLTDVILEHGLGAAGRFIIPRSRQVASPPLTHCQSATRIPAHSQ